MYTKRDILEERSSLLFGIMEDCTLCPRHCKVNRRAGERGFCNLPDMPVLASALPHFGEEPPLSFKGGAGTLFFSSCNLRCLYCQNYQISREGMGRVIGPEALCRVIMDLQEQGCCNIEAVTVTPHLPGFIKALALAVDRGLRLPLVYNSGGYEDPGVLKLLDGVVDIYLPDLKYGNNACAFELSGVSDYLDYVIPSIQEMVRQVGDNLVDEGHGARRGIIIRHLVLPGMGEDSVDVLKLIKRYVSTSVPISIMAQYTPTPAVEGHERLGRRITREEYDYVVDHALHMGFDHIFVQDTDCDEGDLPDFNRDAPFSFDI